MRRWKHIGSSGAQGVGRRTPVDRAEGFFQGRPAIDLARRLPEVLGEQLPAGCRARSELKCRWRVEGWSSPFHSYDTDKVRTLFCVQRRMEGRSGNLIPERWRGGSDCNRASEKNWTSDRSPCPATTVHSEAHPTGSTEPKSHATRERAASRSARGAVGRFRAGARITSVFSLHGFDGVVPFGH